MLKHIKDNFEEEVIKNDKPVLVDFFATWCGPCKMIAPILEKIGNERTDFDVAKVNIDESLELATRYDIQVVPTMLLFKNGNVIATTAGAMPETEIIKFVEKNLN